MLARPVHLAFNARCSRAGTPVSLEGVRQRRNADFHLYINSTQHDGNAVIEGCAQESRNRCPVSLLRQCTAHTLDEVQNSCPCTSSIE